MNDKLSAYLNAPDDTRPAVIKAQYLARAPGGEVSFREQMLFHFENLQGFTRRLNLVECKINDQPPIKPSAILKTDLLVCVEICKEVIQETIVKDAQFQKDTDM